MTLTLNHLPLNKFPRFHVEPNNIDCTLRYWTSLSHLHCMKYKECVQLIRAWLQCWLSVL